jgi:eukaryotic-like serine/threonine-protein kinase
VKKETWACCRSCVARSMAVQAFVPADIEVALGRRYAVTDPIPAAGQGAVFRATRLFQPDTAANHDVVALKLRLHRPEMGVPSEMATVEQISDPCLSKLIEYGDCDVAGRHARYAAWEFIEGQPLSTHLKSGPLTESEVIEIGRDVSAAIAAIWSKRIVHGDIKPSNIILRPSGGAALIDLGSSRYFAYDDSPAARVPLGTAGYLSPEQARGEKNLSYASDIFSLGVVLLESLLGRHPTDHQQSALAYGIRASGGMIAANAGFVCQLDKMLSARPVFRPVAANLSRVFQSLLERMAEDFTNDQPLQRRRA